jgi:hypothetical protein
LLLRFDIDDLKAFYFEAAAAGGAKPSSRQLGDWFWNDTAAGAAVRALRVAHLASEDERLKLIAANFWRQPRGFPARVRAGRAFSVGSLRLTSPWLLGDPNGRYGAQ